MQIRRRVLEFVAAHAREGFPDECCGILLSDRDDPSTVGCALRAANAESNCPDRKYQLDHKTHLKAVKLEILHGVRIAAYYHSHPKGPARPSPRDIDQAVSGVTYLITSMGNGAAEHVAWRRDGDAIVAEPVLIKE